MSVRFTADTIVASASNNSSSSMLSQPQQSGQVYRGIVDDSMSSNIAVTQALMNNCQQDHQGRHMEPGTPSSICNNASSMSSDYNNFNNNNNVTSQAAPVYSNLQASAHDLFIQFHEAIALEPKYQPSLFLPQQSNVSTTASVKVSLSCQLSHTHSYMNFM